MKDTGSSARVDVPGHGALEHVGIPPGLQAFASTLTDAGTRGYGGRGEQVRGAWDGPAGRPIGNELKAALPDVNLAHQRRDAHRRRRTGQPCGDLVATLAAEVCRAAGATQVFRLDWAPLILHVQSSMRMGHREQDSVVRPTGEARFVDGLFIADNSVLPNGLGGPNPTLTTQALATRTAEVIAQRSFDRDPWVRTGTPSSPPTRGSPPP